MPTITEQLAEIERELATYDDPGAVMRLTSSHVLVARYRQLINDIGLHVLPPEPGTDDRTEQIMVELHGVDVSVRGRTDGDGGGDLYVHIGQDNREPADRATYPLTVEVEGAGAHTYGQ